jgi:hypothetical protein
MPKTQSRTASNLVNLNGAWDLYVHGQWRESIPVPCSLRPHGFYRLQRTFLLPRLVESQRSILHFEAVTYYAQVAVNGQELGTMAPYVPHEFDFSAHAREGKNSVEVDIVDACPGPEGLGKDALNLGITVGWETYGGIIRDVWAEIRPSAFVNNVRFAYALNPDYTLASCAPKIVVDSSTAQSCECQLSLFYGQSEISRAQSTLELKYGMNEVPLQFQVHAPALWSPEEPNLYELQATVKTAAGEHGWGCLTGFREVRIRGTQFQLNGQPIALRGVCRMELWKDQGFTMSLKQREQDMSAIKRMGANFVRLQPFPHDRGIVELADQLGLLVSEEPGYWWADFRKCARSFIDLGLDVLERNIRRDWNSPSVMCWFLGNESYFTVDYLKEAKAVCNRLDPWQRPVSIAHENAEPAQAKKLFDDSGMDFYDWHAYSFSEDKFEKIPEAFGPSKPLTFSEWGWEDAGNDCLFYERYFDKLLSGVESGRIAGYMFFDWNDYPQFTREDWSTGKDGMLNSGVVFESRQIREPIYSRLAGLFAGKSELLPCPPNVRPKALPLRSTPFAPASKFRSIDLQALADSEVQHRSWTALEKDVEEFWASSGYSKDQWERTGKSLRFWVAGVVEINGVRFRSPLNEGYVRPLVVSPGESKLIVPIHQPCARLHLLGQVSFPLGYPLRGTLGETVATYTLEYAGGRKQAVPVRWGMEVVQANCIAGATRITPIAINAEPVLQFIRDVAREQYQLLLWSVPIRSGVLESLHCRATGSKDHMAIFAITTEEP